MIWFKNNKIPLLVVCGPTASGKTGLGIDLAEKLDGEVISADSMQIYKGLDILTAAPTPEETRGIPHHLIDILEPGESFSVADYVSLAHQKAEEIISRGKLPIVVGGAGLYINSLVDNICFEDSVTDSELRSKLEKEAAEYGNGYMLEKLRSLDPDAAAKLHENNVVRVIRAIEMYMLTGRTFEENSRLSRQTDSPYEVCMIGLTFEDRQQLYDRVNLRVTLMDEAGMIEEARKVYENTDTQTSAQAIGFKELIPFFKGEMTKEEALDNIRKVSRHYAKRQLTWFRRDERIHWINRSEIVQNDRILNNALNIVEKSEIMCYNKM